MVLLFCLSLGGLAPAAAEETEETHPAISVGYQPAWYLMAGATGGAAFRSAGTGGFVGAEASVVRMHNDLWFGLYTDGAYDFGRRSPVLSIGPEFGYDVLGLDTGAGLRWSSGAPVAGVMSRLSVNTGVVGFYGRHIYWFGPQSHAIQAGMTLKFPLISPWGPGSVRPRRSK
jgi:hypothetical protein